MELGCKLGAGARANVGGLGAGAWRQ